MELQNWFTDTNTEYRIQIPGETVRIEECQVHLVITLRVKGSQTIGVTFLHDVTGTEKGKLTYDRFYSIGRIKKIYKSTRPQLSSGEKKPRKLNPKSLSNLRQFINK